MSWHTGPERDAWVRARRDLRGAQRRSVVLAQVFGRPLGDPRLRGAAIARAAYIEAADRRMWEPGSAFRWIRWALVALCVLNAALGVLRLTDGDGLGGLLLVLWGGQAVLWANYRNIMRATVRRARRTVESTLV